MLETLEVNKRYGDVVAVDNVDVRVQDGELFSILGPSGSGKSSLLECIAGLEIPDGGSIKISGDEVTNNRAYNRDTAMVFQSLALFPHMTVEENILYGVKRQDVPREERKKRVDNMLELVDLIGYEKRGIEELSGGEQQRVALARALVVQPEVILLDEALGSLDQQLRIQLQDELYEIQRELRQTMVYVTHDQNVAFSISDRVAVMNDGSVEQVGTPEELYEEPQTPFIAEFVGSSNAFDTRVKSIRQDTVDVVVEEKGTILKGRSIDGDIRKGDTTRAVIKLEDIDINQPNGHENVFEGEIINRKYQGQNSNLLLTLQEDMMMNVMTEDPWEYSPGDTLTLSWNKTDCLVYSGR